MKFTNRFDFKSDLLFANLDQRELAKIKSVTENLKFSSGDKLFYEDGIPTGMFQLIKGRVKKYKTVLDNQQQIFYVYTKNDLFGYHALLSQERYQDSCEALEDVEVNFISGINFQFLLSEIPTLKDAFLMNMAHEFGVLANTIAILAQKSQNVRLALFLMVLQKRFQTKILGSKGVDLTREDLANIIGTSRESLSRSINFLKK
jgi:CRP-like cAMP-binding protein